MWKESSAEMKGNRLMRVSDLLRKEIARILGETLRDPRLGFVTITRVEVSSDLRNATVHISTLGDDAEFRETVTILNHAAPYIRHELKECRLDLRNLPMIHFKGDPSLREAQRIQELLRSVQIERDAAAEAVPADDEAGSGPASGEPGAP